MKKLLIKFLEGFLTVLLLLFFGLAVGGLLAFNLKSGVFYDQRKVQNWNTD